MLKVRDRAALNNLFGLATYENVGLTFFVSLIATYLPLVIKLRIIEPSRLMYNGFP